MSISVRQWDDPTSWNRFVAAVHGAHFQQGWEWGELGPSLGGLAVRLAACQAGEMVGAMQVFINPVHRSQRTLLMVPRGPALPRATVQSVAPLLEAARSLGHERNSIGIRVEPNVSAMDTPYSDTLTTLGLHPSYPPSQPRSSWILDLGQDEDTILAEMKQKTRYNIRLAARKGVEVHEAGLGDLDAFYALYQQTSERDDFFIHDQPLYRTMFSLYQQTGSFCMLFARYRGQLIGAVTLLRMGETCWYLHGASSNEHRNLMATYLLQWEAIQRAKRWGCSLYDFRAVPDLLREDQDMYGVYRFKEGFGGRQFTTLDTHSAAYRPGVFGLWQAYYTGRFALQAVQRRRRGLPARQFA
ncbi:MAG: peptidoglycan bridge formation glycyltransferase FemA/FemB family protein [Chloroflexota bacterium]|nr:peptidoglycan bridge formation glycyltransferase FemA/FemB family protein [Chloroflexota bacterium]